MTEPTNIPCGRCGAPMHEDAGGHLAAAIEMRCVYCGAIDALPRDAEQRVLAMRALRQQRRWAEDAARGPILTYVRMFERPGWLFAPYLFGAFVLAVGAVQAGRLAAVPIGIVGGIAAASYGAVWRARRRLAATVVPLLRALPAEPGLPQRCRRCGGALPASASAFVTCRYCDAPNLASRAVLGAHHAVLAAQTSLGHAYATETATALAHEGRHVARLLRGAFFVGAAVGGGVGWLALRAW
ncbi:MAG TPA: hypothetical protein VFQ53_37015 [Kofleriaceae bacterium]|nr:hypothetical protein [Kofleriaceae bacterium]